MNNQQFRKLLTSESAGTSGTSKEKQHERPKPGDSVVESAKFMSMAPRNVKTSNVFRSHDSSKSQPTTKRFKSCTPKGSAMATGYIDRAKARAGAEEVQDEKAAQIKVLEDKMKAGELSLERFEALREEITGGDISSTHLVKGLDRTLLDRVRRGEDVLGVYEQNETRNNADVVSDAEDKLDKLAEVDTVAVQKDKVEKKGIATTESLAGRKRTRDEIMADLKAQRKAAQDVRAAKEPALDHRWRRVDDKQKSRIEVDRKGREVLVTVDEDGVVKRRVRKTVHVEDDKPLMQLDITKDVLGADVEPALPQVEQNAVATTADDVDDDDIFEGVGTDYDPLGPDLESDDEDLAASADKDVQDERTSPQDNDENDQRPRKKMNYFNDRTATEDHDETDRMAGIKAIIEKAAKLAPKEDQPQVDDVDAVRRARHAQMLANRDRDLEDMDMGFGENRLADGEDNEDSQRIRLSEWKGNTHDHDDEDDGKQDAAKKKRKPKKRKGDVNNISDIMGVIQRRKDGGK